MGPVVTPVPTTQLICVPETTVKERTGVPLKVIAVVPVSPLPLMVTAVPELPLVGLNPLIVGAGVVVTVKLPALVPVPAAVVTLIAPLVAPVGTLAVIWVPEFTVKVVAAVPLKATLVAPLSPAPLMVTDVPVGPLVGVNPLMEGAGVATTVKGALVAVPAGVITLTGPVVAPVGTVVVICVSEFTVKMAAVPLKLTEVARVRPVPVTVTEVPVGPLVGLSPLMVGAGAVTA
jgi:hypothetical protein